MTSVFDKKENCCGCGLCAEICPKSAIKMEMIDGSYYPVIDAEKCIDCGICAKNCDFQNGKEEPGDPQCFAARIKEDAVRLKSSSGGAFTVISNAILRNGGVVCGAVYDDDMQVVHKCAINSFERDKMRGAKYVQSNLNSAFGEMEAALKEGSNVLFSGTPCQVAAAKKRFAKYAEQLTTVDLICHGVPQVSVWNEYINYLQNFYGKRIVDYKFRDKSKSWRQYHAVVTFDDGSKASDTPQIDSYIEIFRYDLALRASCAKCPYASIHRQGDITIGDFWGIQNHFPEMDDDRGVSALMLNSEKGKAFAEILSDEMWLTPCDAQQIAAGQPNMSKPSSPSVKYAAFQKDMAEMPFSELLKKYTNVGFKRRMIDLAKRIIKR